MAQHILYYIYIQYNNLKNKLTKLCFVYTQLVTDKTRLLSSNSSK